MEKPERASCGVKFPTPETKRTVSNIIAATSIENNSTTNKTKPNVIRQITNKISGVIVYAFKVFIILTKWMSAVKSDFNSLFHLYAIVYFNFLLPIIEEIIVSMIIGRFMLFKTAITKIGYSGSSITCSQSSNNLVSSKNESISFSCLSSSTTSSINFNRFDSNSILVRFSA